MSSRPDLNLEDNEIVGSDSAFVEHLYSRLHHIAEAHLNHERADHTLQTTALVHEAYLRLCESERSTWKDRTHFLAIASRVMRQVLVNHANRRNAAKREGKYRRCTLVSNIPDGEPNNVDLIELNDALTRLAERSERQARIVEMRFLAGMTIREVAQVLGISTTTVEDDWYGARAWLSRELSESQ